MSVVTQVTAASIIGCWRMVRWVNRSDESGDLFPMGEQVDGHIIYTADQRLAVVITAGRRPAFASDDPFGGSDEEKIAAFSTAVAYSGRWELVEDHLIHHIELATFPNWAGVSQVRLVSIDEGLLTLSTPPMLLQGALRVPDLTWERVPS